MEFFPAPTAAPAPAPALDAISAAPVPVDLVIDAAPAAPASLIDPLLESILITKRAHNSPGELSFLQWLYKTLGTLGFAPKAMAEGCIVVENKPNKVLFSCHVDTVHTPSLCQKGTQTLFYDAGQAHIFLGEKEQGGCLGADDGAGIYILLQMLKHDVPGTYIFHRGEERGGIGSNAMLLKHRAWLGQFNQCVAFDRAGTEDIIITQGGVACASLAYATSLQKELGKHGLSYAPSHRGSFTDSKVYRGVIPECINLSVGYDLQHSAEEYLNVEHLYVLCEAVFKIDWAGLTIARDPVEPFAGSSAGRHSAGFLGESTVRHAAGRLNGYGFDGDKYYGSANSLQKTSANAEPSKAKGKGKAKVTSLVSKPLPAISAIDLECMNYMEILKLTGDEDLADAIVELVARKAESEARARVYRNLCS